MEPALFLGLALVLGVKHAYDADHLAAVSNFLGRSTSVREATRLSLFWAAGHLVTATAVMLVLWFAGRELLGGLLARLDLLVAFLLVAVGAVALLWELSLVHRHAHAHAHAHGHGHGHASHEHAHLHLLGRLRRRAGLEGGEHRALLGIGIVHGIASNDELLLLFTTALGVTSLAGMLAGVVVFSAGVVAGMVLFGVALSYPLLRWGRARVHRAVNLASGAASLALGLWLLAGLGGFNLLDLAGLGQP